MAGYACESCGYKYPISYDRCPNCKARWVVTVPGRPEQVRGSTHGDYTHMAVTAQNIKCAMRAGDEGRAAWGRLRPVQTESLELIATKLARIMCGDSCCEDHWRDIAGYAILVADRIKSGELKC